MERPKQDNNVIVGMTELPGSLLTGLQDSHCGKPPETLDASPTAQTASTSLSLQFCDRMATE